MLNQLGASLGIALVALLMQNAGPDRPVAGFQHAYTAVVAALLVMIVAAFFIPGRATPTPTPPAGPGAAEAPPSAAQGGGEQPAR
ncbi:hypothetical protein ACOKM5_38295 [Streptomyces sp. BH097]|uniref:hypothetical protein n=1 Tax=unclassified Streptomyces TaxID=2593676 RepID=UPI003BB5EB41